MKTAVTITSASNHNFERVIKTPEYSFREKINFVLISSLTLLCYRNALLINPKTADRTCLTKGHIDLVFEDVAK